MDFTMLVNKENPLDKDYVPENMQMIGSFCSESDKLLVKEACINFEIMCSNALKNNMNIKAVSAYRSYDYQKKLYEYYLKTRGLKYASKCSAKPGYSEHQTGLAVDVMGENGDYNLFGETKEFTWMVNNSYKYGFILRYPSDKEKITGYKYEPWHYRYVGVNLATKLFSEKITLEEYYLNKSN